MHRPLVAPFAILVAALALILTAMPATAGGPGHGDEASSDSRRGRHGAIGPGCTPAVAGRQLEILHGPVEITLVDPASDGHQVGDLRATSVATTDATGAPMGRLDATLTTTAVDVPAPGDEVRISTLVFSFGDAGIDQLVVGGSAVYPAQGATLATGSTTTRPIQGGSGRFAGVLGSAVSEHLADGSWRHTLDLSRGAAGFGPAAVLGAGRDRLRSFDIGVELDRAEHDPARMRDILRALWMRLGDPDHTDMERSVLRRLERPAERSAVRRLDRRPARLFHACNAHAPEALSPPVYEGLQGAPIDEPGITRNELGRTLPAGAAGQELGLWHYTIPAGAVLEPHTHAGSQIARVITGELEYTVISGDGTILAADGTATPIGPGTYVLHAGDSVIEDPDMEHFGANRGPGVVELVAATLYPEGAPLSIPLETAAPGIAGAHVPGREPDALRERHVTLRDASRPWTRIEPRARCRRGRPPQPPSSPASRP